MCSCEEQRRLETVSSDAFLLRGLMAQAAAAAAAEAEAMAEAYTSICYR